MEEQSGNSSDTHEQDSSPELDADFQRRMAEARVALAAGSEAVVEFLIKGASESSD